MKAWVLHKANDLRPEEVPVPIPAADEALVRVYAAGICGSDIPRIFETGAHVHPIIPGHEFSGTAEEVGDRTDTKWLGKRVCVFPMIPCGKCVCCREGRYELCRNYSYLGSRRDGGFAEYAAVPVRNLIELPEAVSFEAAAMLEPMAVAVHAMRGIGCGREETVAVIGQGTIGRMLVMFLKEAGVERLLVVGNKDIQRERASLAGIGKDAYCDARQTDASAWIMERTDGVGADVVFECTGRNMTAVQAIASAGPGGRVMLVGNPSADMTFARDVYWKILRNQLTVCGTWNSSFTGEADDDWHYVLRRVAEGTVDPEALISHRLPPERLSYGLRIMRDKTEDYMKIMIGGQA